MYLQWRANEIWLQAPTHTHTLTHIPQCHREALSSCAGCLTARLSPPGTGPRELKGTMEKGAHRQDDAPTASEGRARDARKRRSRRIRLRTALIKEPNTLVLIKRKNAKGLNYPAHSSSSGLLWGISINHFRSHLK